MSRAKIINILDTLYYLPDYKIILNLKETSLTFWYNEHSNTYIIVRLVEENITKLELLDFLLTLKNSDVISIKIDHQL